jgi:cytochrome c oxidase cbb3-type subunit 3/ubiquinol-cytochrome c reductase cytochrome c subunit
MTIRKKILIGITGVALLLNCACRRFPGEPEGSAEAPGAESSVNFEQLYSQNCAGCHGANGQGGPALALANPIYLAVAPDASIRRTVAQGIRGTMMPAFATTFGGMLTDAQIDEIVRGLKEKWSRREAEAVSSAPPYSRDLAGDPSRGAVDFQVNCAQCHGNNGEGGPKGGDVVDDSFLALVSDQGLRTTILAGRPDLGHPDWRGDGSHQPLTDQELTDIVAWLGSKRVTAPGRPYPGPKEATN